MRVMQERPGQISVNKMGNATVTNARGDKRTMRDSSSLLGKGQLRTCRASNAQLNTRVIHKVASLVTTDRTYQANPRNYAQGLERSESTRMDNQAALIISYILKQTIITPQSSINEDNQMEGRRRFKKTFDGTFKNEESISSVEEDFAFRIYKRILPQIRRKKRRRW